MFDLDGRLLASSDSSDNDRLGQRIEHPAWPKVLRGEESVETVYSRSLQAEIADVLYPVVGLEENIVGVIRLSHRLASVQELFLRMRYLIIGVVVFGLGVGVFLAMLLALNMERPLRQVTLAVYNLTRGKLMFLPAEQGPQEIRLLLKAVNTLVERLRSLEEARRQLLANLVHELGRPLGAVHSALWALSGRAGGDAATRQELLTGIEGEVVRLERLLDNLAQLHDQVLGALELDLQPINANDWLREVLISWEQLALQKGLHWELEIPTGLQTFEADPDRLAQAVGNLVNNAIKYTPEDGKICITAGQENDQIWIRVSDTGRGISPEEQVQIFKPLYRGAGGGRFPQGMGLGLSITHDLVAAHGGCVEVDSQLNRGSQFTIRIPIQQMDAISTDD
jgi:signal transduction histidine kinase